LVSLTWYALLGRLALAAILGAVVGLEREVRERQAGLRTHMLVSLGSALFTIVSAYAWTDFTFGNGIAYDPTRIAAQIVTGVGFLGAGAILHQGQLIRGLTTAATLWIVAAVGMAVGAGYWLAALIATALVLFALEPVRLAVTPLLDRLHSEEALLHVEMRAGEGVGNVVDALEKAAVARLSEVEHVTGARWGR